MFALLKKPVRAAKPKPLETVKRTLHVGDRAMPLTIRENRRATRITLRIEPGGRGLNLTVPAGLRSREIDDFLDRHQGWLVTKLAKFSSDNSIRSGGRIAFRGVSHRIEHTGTLRGLTEAVLIDGEPVLKVSGLEDHMGRRLSAFFKKEARKELEVLVARHAAAIRKPIKSVSMKDTRSRWGSCSWDGNLSFSWRIVMAPPSRHRLSRGPRSGASEGDEPRPEILGSLQRALPANGRGPQMAEAARLATACDRFRVIAEADGSSGQARGVGGAKRSLQVQETAGR